MEIQGMEKPEFHGILFLIFLMFLLTLHPESCIIIDITKKVTTKRKEDHRYERKSKKICGYVPKG